MPPHPSPPSIASGDLKVDLLPHQSEALQWMIEHEYPVLPEIGGKPVQLWSRHESIVDGESDYWYNRASKKPQSEPPVLGRGGIIADDMGLGRIATTQCELTFRQDTHDSRPYSGHQERLRHWGLY